MLAITPVVFVLLYLRDHSGIWWLYECDCLCQVILDLVSYKELTIRRLIDDKFTQPGIGLVSKVNDTPQLKPLMVWVQCLLICRILTVRTLSQIQSCILQKMDWLNKGWEYKHPTGFLAQLAWNCLFTTFVRRAIMIQSRSDWPGFWCAMRVH